MTIDAEALRLGYAVAALIFIAAIAAIAIAHRFPGLDALVAFWTAHIPTRHLGDPPSQPAGAGGLGLGTVVASVVFLSVTKQNQLTLDTVSRHLQARHR
jgi:uncharacterized membrane-anchored protein